MWAVGENMSKGSCMSWVNIQTRHCAHTFYPKDLNDLKNLNMFTSLQEFMRVHMSLWVYASLCKFSCILKKIVSNLATNGKFSASVAKK